METMKLLVVLLLCGCAGFAAPVMLHAQSNPPFQNPSLDSNCYFPQIGDPGEMDTILGADTDQYLGSFVKNLGPKPDGSFGNLFISNLSPTVAITQVATGPGFDLHQMRQYLQKLSPDASNGFSQGIRLCHFRDRAHEDIWDPYVWRIYWADDNGNYDSTNFSRLWFSKRGDHTGDAGLAWGYIEPYIARLTSDSVDDIILSFVPDFIDFTKDTIFLALFRGGERANLKDTIYEDSSYPLFSKIPENPWRFCTQGDFRGTGRDDLILADDSGANIPGVGGNLWYFANDPPFSLQKLAQAILYDTLMAHWQNPHLSVRSRPGYSNSYFVMPAFSHPAYSRVIDFLPIFFIDTENFPSIFMFRGGPDFGSRRITLDSAAYIIRKPAIFQSEGWPGPLGDAGDMTGTGNHVLYTTAGSGDYDWDAFFVTGLALDDKIDIYNSHPYGEGAGDTLTANPDSLEDYIFHLAQPYYTGGVPGAGSLWLYYGTKNIPVHLNPKFSDVRSIPKENGAGINFSPNPTPHDWSVAMIVWPIAEIAEYDIYNLLGEVVQSGTMQMLGGAEQQRIYFPNLASGVYEVLIHGSSHEARAKLVIVH